MTPEEAQSFDWFKYAVGGAAAREDSFSKLNPEYASRVQQLILAADQELGPGALKITSAYRSPEKQAELYAAAVKKYGSEAAARKWVAPPGKSKHNAGMAVDFADASGSMLRDPNSREAQWIKANAGRFGLDVPMSWEPWQVELAGSRDGSSSPNSSMSSPAKYREAIASIESAGSGGYSAIGPASPTLGRPLGKYQMMEANIPAWSKAALGREVSVDEFLANPKIQDAIFDHTFGGYVAKYGEKGAAEAWFAGPGGVGKGGRTDSLGTSVSGYGDKFLAALSAYSPSGMEADGPGRVDRNPDRLAWAYANGKMTPEDAAIYERGMAEGTFPKAQQTPAPAEQPDPLEIYAMTAMRPRQPFQPVALDAGQVQNATPFGRV